MIHSARPTVSAVVNIVFTWNLFCFSRFTYVQTDGQHVWKQWSLPVVTVGRPSGSIHAWNVSYVWHIHLNTWMLYLFSFMKIIIAMQMRFTKGFIHHSKHSHISWIAIEEKCNQLVFWYQNGNSMSLYHCHNSFGKYMYGNTHALFSHLFSKPSFPVPEV